MKPTKVTIVRADARPINFYRLLRSIFSSSPSYSSSSLSILHSPPSKLASVIAGDRFLFPAAAMEALQNESISAISISQEASSSIAIKVLFFARARDLTGVSDMPLEVPSGSTTSDCLNELVLRFPSLKEIYGCMVMALNEEYTTESATVRNNDELAIIPPISGG